MSANEISKEIAALEMKVTSTNNKVIAKTLKSKIDKLKEELVSVAQPTEAKMKLAKAKAKIRSMSKENFDAFVQKLSAKEGYSFLKQLTSDQIKRDIQRVAKPVGWRYRGRENMKKPLVRDIRSGNNVYFENRSNRADVSRAVRLEEGGMMAKGGFVGKGEMVWKKLSASKKAEFLYENFTPQITPRSQETLVGKAYNFLPKNVKIVLESKYANVEDYAKGGGLGSYAREDKTFQDYKIELENKYGKGYKNSDLSEKDFDKLFNLKERRSKSYVNKLPIENARNNMAKGGDVDEMLYYVVGKKKGQLVDVSVDSKGEITPFIKEDAKIFAKNMESNYDYNSLDILPYRGKNARVKMAKGGGVGDTTIPIQVVIDNDWDDAKMFKTFNLAKMYVLKNINKHDFEIVDSYGDSIYIEKDSSKEDLDYLFSDSMAKGGGVGDNKELYALSVPEHEYKFDDSAIGKYVDTSVNNMKTGKNMVYYVMQIAPKDKLMELRPLGYRSGMSTKFKFVKEYGYKPLKGKKMANGGGVGKYAEGGSMRFMGMNSEMSEYELEMLQGKGGNKGVSIKEMNKILSERFPYSFGFTLRDTKTRDDLRYLKPNEDNPLKGIQDESIRLSFDSQHTMDFRIFQGGENTYFMFLLFGSDDKEYIGEFGFKSRGDVPKEYITSFISFLCTMYGFPFKVSHNVYAKGGTMEGGLKKKEDEFIIQDKEVYKSGSKWFATASKVYPNDRSKDAMYINGEGYTKKEALADLENNLSYYAKGGGIDKSLISSLPKNRRADKKYTHFAVGKSDNKILNGWDYSDYDSEDLNSDKYHYFDYDMKDMDYTKKDYTIKKAQSLIREGINPFDFDNWRKLDFSNDKMANGGSIYSQTKNTADGNIVGEVKYNVFYKTYQVVIDGVVYEEFKTKSEAIENLKNAGFNKMANGGGIGDDDDLLEFTIPTWAITSLVYGDDSGLEDEDIEKLNKFVDKTVSKYGNANFMIGSDEDMEAEFRYRNDIDGSLGGDVVTMYLRPNKMAKGGDIDGVKYYVAVSESKDGYWTIMSRPTHDKWVAETLLKGSVPKNEIGKVVTLEEARNHRKVVGEEYLTEDMIARPPKYAQGGELHRSQMK
jgi:hypothetical protein